MESRRLFFVLVGPHVRLNDLPSIWNCERGRTLLFISWTRWLFRMLLYLAGSQVYRIFPVLSWKKRWPCSSSDHSAGVAQSSIKDQFFPSFLLIFLLSVSTNSHNYKNHQRKRPWSKLIIILAATIRSPFGKYYAALYRWGRWWGHKSCWDERVGCLECCSVAGSCGLSHFSGVFLKLAVVMFFVRSLTRVA